jgi:hypothetical protein
METDSNRVRRRLHPLVWRSLLVVAALWVFIAWVLFARGGYSSVIVAVVTLFTIIIGTASWTLYRTWQRHPESHPAEAPREDLRNWLAGDFEIWGGQVKARDALAGILIPFGAVILGGILIGIAFDLS